MGLSDIITKEIIRMINESEVNTAEIQRNEFATLMGCVPSQINYVLSSRFTPEHGYIIESRRGGGGYIKIKRITLNHTSAIMHIINSIGDTIDALSTRIVIENCLQTELIDEKQAKLICAALSNTSLQAVPPVFRDSLRAALIKQMLLSLI